MTVELTFDELNEIRAAFKETGRAEFGANDFDKPIETAIEAIVARRVWELGERHAEAAAAGEVWAAAYADHSGIYLYPTEIAALRDAVENGLTIVKPIAIDGKRNLLEELR